MTDDDEVLLLIEQELRPLLRESREITPDSQIMADLGLDSLAVMDFIMVLEERFEIVIPVDQLADVRTVRDLARTVQEIRARTPASTAA
ncbi:acyl carrier protein [Roseomonas sp. BN140053]|uniref:acyl carrier protein n=1 Tax=Roseomonas sp. BN140053 TaxID=3391898 RepID=UPI0039E7C92B